MPLSRHRAVFEWGAIVLMLMAPAVGVFLFGAVRLWSICPLMFLSFIGAAMCFSRGAVIPEWRKSYRPIGGFLWLVFLVYAMAFGLRSAVPYDSKIEVLKIASYLAAYWAWTSIAVRQGRWRILFAVFIVAATTISWYAIIQHGHGSRMVLNLERPEVYGMRASGTYFCPNHFASLLETVLPVCLALLVAAKAGFTLRLLAGYGLVVCLPALYLTQSRSGWIAAIGGMLVTAGFLALRRSRRAFLITLVAGPLLVALLAGSLWAASPMIRERVRGASLSNPDSAVQARFMMWKDSIPMIQAKPWMGYGPGTFVWVYPRFKSEDVHFLFNYAHNEYLHALVDYGAIGLLLLAACVGWTLLRLMLLVRRVGRDREACLIAGLLGSIAAALAHAFFDFNLHIFSNNHFLFLAAGVITAMLYASNDLQAKPLSASRAWVGWGMAALAAILSAVLTAQVFFSYGFHLLGEWRREALATQEAEKLFHRARRIDSANWRPYQGLGHVYRTKSFWDLDPGQKREDATVAIQWYEEALARNPYDMETVFGLATVYNTAGDQEQALKYMQTAVWHEPRNPFYVGHLGLQLRRMGRLEEALDVFRDASLRWRTEMIRLNVRFLENRIARDREQQALPIEAEQDTFTSGGDV